MNWKKILKKDWEDRIKRIEAANKRAQDRREKDPKSKAKRTRTPTGSKMPRPPHRMRGGGHQERGEHTTKRTKSKCDMCTRLTNVDNLIPTESGLKYCKTCAKSKDLI